MVKSKRSSNLDLYTTAPVSKAVISLAAPTILSQVITVIYNMADTFFIGQLNDPAQLAAATQSMPPFILLTGIANLLGIGGTSLISRSLGKGDNDKAKRTASFCILSAIAVAFLYGIFIMLAKPWLLPLMGTKDTTYEYCYSYLFWTVTVGAVPTVLNACLAHLIRAEGLSKHAGFGVALGGILNIGLDPLFIFGFNMDITGAAIATALSNFIATIYFVAVIFTRRKTTVINANPKNFTLGLGIPKEVLTVGLPSFIMNLMAIVSNTVLNNLMSQYPDEATAGLGIAKKIDMLTLAISMGMTQGVISLIGFNYTSKNRKRMLSAIKTSFIYTLALSVVTTLFLFFCAAPVSSVFIQNEETVAYAKYFMRVLCLICPMQATALMIVTIYQAIGKKVQPLILSFLRKGVIDTPFMLLMNYSVGVYGIPWATPIAEFIGMAISVALFIPTFKRLKSSA